MAKKTNKAVDEIVVEEATISPETKEKTVKEQPKRKLRLNEIDKSTEVVIQNNLTGGLVYICPKNYTKYHLAGFGDVDEMPINELTILKNTKRKFLERYWIIITDVSTGKYSIEEILEALKISYLYEGDYSVMLDVDGFILGNTNQVKKIYPKLNEYAKEIIIKRASQLYRNGHISSLPTYQYFSELPEAIDLF